MKTSIKEIKANGGVSINAKGQHPTSGYMVGGTVEKVIALSDSDIQKFIEDNSHIIETGSYFGAWVYNGDVVCDVSQQFDSLQQAAYIGMLRGEKAIYDVKNNRDISLPPVQCGTGKQVSTYADIKSREIEKKYKS